MHVQETIESMTKLGAAADKAAEAFQAFRIAERGGNMPHEFDNIEPSKVLNRAERRALKRRDRRNNDGSRKVYRDA